jgi:hypothetical protein
VRFRINVAPLGLTILAMEASLEFPFAYAWLFGGYPAHAFLLLLAALASYVAGVQGWLPVSRFSALLYGGGWGLFLHLLYAHLPIGTSVPVLLGWLLGALPTALVGAFLWWRGQVLAVDLPSARWVLNAFTFVGAGLLFSIGFYGAALNVDPLLSVGLIVVFLVAGLIAVALGRQEEAGAGSTSLVAVTVVGVVALGALPSVLLSPQILAIAEGIAYLVGQLLILLITPLIWLLNLLNIQLEDVLPQPSQNQNQNRGDRGTWVPPEWLQVLSSIIATAFVILFVLAAIALVLWIVWEIFQRYALWSRSGKRPATIEREDFSLSDGASALARLRGWLAGAAQRLGERLPNFAGELDARSAEAAYRSRLRWAKRHGVVRAPSETPRDLLDRLTPRVPSARDDLRLLTTTYVYARYGGQVATSESLSALSASLHRLQEVAWAAPPMPEPVAGAAPDG